MHTHSKFEEIYHGVEFVSRVKKAGARRPAGRGPAGAAGDRFPGPTFEN
jgi:hypothetical protein